MGKTNTNSVKAVYKANEVRCEKCNCQLWPNMHCDCGILAQEHKNFNEAFEERDNDFYKFLI